MYSKDDFVFVDGLDVDIYKMYVELKSWDRGCIASRYIIR